MARISVAPLAEASIESLPVDGLTCTGSVRTQALIAGDSDQLHLHYTMLDAGTTLTWDHPTSDFCVHVLKGKIDLNGKSVDQAGTLFIEHGSNGSLRSASDTTLVFFQNREPGTKEGGHIHFIQDENVPQTKHTPGREDVASLLVADAMCPTCDLWLHGNTFPENDGVDPHFHSEDEIILVVSGELVLGPNRFGPNTAVAVPKNTVYSFKSGADGLGFLNFRAGSPTATSRKDKTQIDEGEFFRSRLGRPQHQFVDAGA